MSKRITIMYWGSTLWLALGMFSTGIVQLLKISDGPGGEASMIRLGYPVYLLTLLGVWKLLGVIAILIPKFPLVKEWTYAGFFFIMTGAAYSHIAAGDPPSKLFPSMLLLVLTFISWYLRPAERKITSITNNKGPVQ
jgi:uncharacterized membrane protein YphA (DoxX/SURF4 family)